MVLLQMSDKSYHGMRKKSIIICGLAAWILILFFSIEANGIPTLCSWKKPLIDQDSVNQLSHGPKNDSAVYGLSLNAWEYRMSGEYRLCINTANQAFYNMSRPDYKIRFSAALNE